jgi:hypothetical protein
MSGLREDYLIISFCGMEYRERMKWGIYLEPCVSLVIMSVLQRGPQWELKREGSREANAKIKITTNRQEL